MSGTHALLLTDVVDSTQLSEALGDAVDRITGVCPSRCGSPKWGALA